MFPHVDVDESGVLRQPEDLILAGGLVLVLFLVMVRPFRDGLDLP